MTLTVIAGSARAACPERSLLIWPDGRAQFDGGPPL